MTNYCPYCFDDPTLVRQLELVRPTFPDDQKCDFHPSRKAIPGDYVVSLFDRVIRSNYGPSDYHQDCNSGQTLADIIYDIASPDDDEVVRQLVSALIEADDYDPRDGGEPFFGDDQSYDRFDWEYSDNHSSWDRFKDEILHRKRFLSEHARRYLDRIFADVHLQKDKGGKPVVYSLLPSDSGSLIFRARQIDDPQKRKETLENPGLLLGTPPPGLRRANRMNAAGIPAFYGAFDIETCIAEIRPSVGCTVVSAAFQLTRPIVVLDTTRFAKPIMRRSIFSPVYRERVSQWQFMQRFMREISHPILPNDETLEYVPTQVVSEFVNSELKIKLGGKDRHIDGIVYNSAQKPDGRNIVLFGDAALCQDASMIGPSSTDELTEGLDDWDFEVRLGPKKPALRPLIDQTSQLRIESVSFQSTQCAEFEYEDF